MLLAHESRPSAVVLNDTLVDLHHGSTRVMQAIETLLDRAGFAISLRVPRTTDWRQMPGFVEAAGRAQIIVVNGEGTIHHDRIAGQVLVEIGDLANSLGVPAVLVNALWQSNSAALAQKLKKFSLVSVRDTMSLLELGQHGITSRVVPDFSLYLPAPPPTRPRGGIAFTDSVERQATLELEKLRQRLGGQLLPIQFEGSDGAAFLRFVRAGLAKADLPRFDVMLGMLLARVRQYRSQIGDEDTFIARLSSFGLLVSGRFHACTLALLTETPFVAGVTNSHKIHALIADAGLSPWRISRELTPALIKEAADSGWEAREQAAIKAYVADARAEAEKLFNDIRRLV